MKQEEAKAGYRTQNIPGSRVKIRKQTNRAEVPNTKDDTVTQ